ncbi:MAG TPA: polysaccharide deacetylase family protein [Methylomirabilota bacterium]|jgi:peptidoglycan/xylan/chitin deacetylase (PgdA/CDA1 family)|nr:polysaccharide deacetylase family protein [Methylomirabilota bacterium]
MSGTGGLGTLVVAAAALAVSACATATEWQTREVFESSDFIVTFAKSGDTTQSLAGRFLGDPAKAWMIEDYNGLARLTPGREVVIPKKPWSPAGVYATGYQLVPVLVYHNLAPQAKGRLIMAASGFEQQMRYLKTHGYRVISLTDLMEYMALGRQLPRRSVVLTFDDGYKSFLQHAYPLLKDLGFPATLFVYTDYVGNGRNALDWDDLKWLANDGFQVGAHSKTHSDLRRHPGEPNEEFTRRMQIELAEPLALFRRRLGRTPHVLAYPYGAHNDELAQKVREHGYIAAFSVRREGNASFVHPLRIRRSQIYADMTLEEFARNLDIFHQEALQ